MIILGCFNDFVFQPQAPVGIVLYRILYAQWYTQT